MLILETGFLAFRASLSGDSSDEEQRVAESKEAEEPEEPQRPATWSDDDFSVRYNVRPPSDVNVGLDSHQ